MGLSERTKYVLENDLRRLLSVEGEGTVDELKRLTLALDRYRRELSLSIVRHSNTEGHLAYNLAEREAAVARWQSRLSLAKSRGRLDLIPEAEERLDQVQSQRQDLREQHQSLAQALANLRISHEKVQRALHLIRRKKSILLGDGQVPGEDTVKSLEAATTIGGPFGAEEQDPLEAAFVELELDEVTRGLSPRDADA